MKPSLTAAAAALVVMSGSASAQLEPVTSAVANATNDCQGHVDAAFQGQRAGAELTANPIDGVFWPPNHKLRTVRITAEETADDGEACDVTITDVRQDEAIDAQGDGNTSPDAANCSNAGNESKVDLRGERSGLGTGRFYTITYTMEDPDSAAIPPKTATATLLVPHDMGKAHFNTYVNEGGTFASYDTPTLECPE